MEFEKFIFGAGLVLLMATGFGATANAADKPVVEMVTTLGTVVIELDAEKAPETVKNFLAYVDAGFYDGTIFHRVIPTFMIQGGGFTEAMQKKPTRAPIKNEAANKLSNKRGTIAMARTSDPQSATAQFFINVEDNSMLDYTASTEAGYGYAVFGKVTSGMDAVDKIRNVKTGMKQGMGDVPVETVVIKSIKQKKTT
jgi:peptidyl-prolyl cis-trans isomerase B (cyclophilin B)